MDYFVFWTLANGGGLQDNNGLYADLGAQLFSGSVGDPTYLTGSGSFYNAVNGNTDTITISAVSTVPEPSTWAMMVVGFAGVGFAAYRRARGNPRIASATA